MENFSHFIVTTMLQYPHSRKPCAETVLALGILLKQEPRNPHRSQLALGHWYVQSLWPWGWLLSRVSVFLEFSPLPCLLVACLCTEPVAWACLTVITRRDQRAPGMRGRRERLGSASVLKLEEKAVERVRSHGPKLLLPHLVFTLPRHHPPRWFRKNL